MQFRKDIEIDLLDLWNALKKNAKVITGVTACFGAAAAIYSYSVLKPVYSYEVMIRIPSHVSDKQINTCLEVLRVQGVNSVSTVKGTSLLKVSATEATPQDAVTIVNEALPKVTNVIDHIIAENDRRNFKRGIVDEIKNNIVAISNSSVNNTFTVEEANRKLQALMDKVERSEAEYLSNNVEIVKAVNEKAIEVAPNRRKNIILAFILGLFLSCGYYISRFLLIENGEKK